MSAPIRKLSIPLLLCAVFFGPFHGTEATEKSLLVTTQWLSEHLNDPNLVILHIGEGDATYMDGHIPGALFAKWDDFVVTRDGIPNEVPDREALIDWVRHFGIEDSSKIVLYDEEKGMQAARAFFTLDVIGLGDQCALLDGQFKAWKSQGREISVERSEPTPSKWTPKGSFHRATIDDREIESILSNPDLGGSPKFLDARTQEYYSGAKKTEVVSRPGRLPRAIQMDWLEAIREGDLPLLKSPNDLSHLLQEKGVREGDPVVTYCNTGRSAAHLYFTLRYLGYDVRLYDGSMSEWALDESHPVEVDSATPANP